MFLYTIIEAIAAVVVGILVAVCTKRADGVSYGKLDKIGRFTNILLLLFLKNPIRYEVLQHLAYLLPYSLAYLELQE